MFIETLKSAAVYWGISQDTESYTGFTINEIIRSCAYSLCYYWDRGEFPPVRKITQNEITGLLKQLGVYKDALAAINRWNIHNIYLAQVSEYAHAVQLIEHGKIIIEIKPEMSQSELEAILLKLMHPHEDYKLYEITDRKVEQNDEGTLVVTSVVKDGYPSYTMKASTAHIEGQTIEADSIDVEPLDNGQHRFTSRFYGLKQRRTASLKANITNAAGTAHAEELEAEITGKYVIGDTELVSLGSHSFSIRTFIERGVPAATRMQCWWCEGEVFDPEKAVEQTLREFRDGDNWFIYTVVTHLKPNTWYTGRLELENAYGVTSEEVSLLTNAWPDWEFGVPFASFVDDHRMKVVCPIVSEGTSKFDTIVCEIGRDAKKLDEMICLPFEEGDECLLGRFGYEGQMPLEPDTEYAVRFTLYGHTGEREEVSQTPVGLIRTGTKPISKPWLIEKAFRTSDDWYMCLAHSGDEAVALDHKCYCTLIDADGVLHKYSANLYTNYSGGCWCEIPCYDVDNVTPHGELRFEIPTLEGNQYGADENLPI